MVERRDSNRKVAKPWLDSRCGSASLSSRKTLNAIPTLGPSSLPAVVAQPNERHANRTASVKEWFDRHRAYNIWLKRRLVFNIVAVHAYKPKKRKCIKFDLLNLVLVHLFVKVPRPEDSEVTFSVFGSSC